MVYAVLMRIFAAAVTALSLGVLIYVYAFPPPSMATNRYGVPFFTPDVVNPETGEAIRIDELVRHFRGD